MTAQNNTFSAHNEADWVTDAISDGMVSNQFSVDIYYFCSLHYLLLHTSFIINFFILSQIAVDYPYNIMQER
jgi:hypothetical protein